jgi:hypothetical protein
MKTQIASVVVLLLLVGGYTLPVTEQMSMGDVVLSPVTGAGTDQPMLAPGSGVVTLADGVTIDLEQQELVRGYLDAYYRSLIDLQVYYPDQLFARDAIVEMVRDKALWEITVAVREMQSADLRLDSYSYEVQCNKVAEQEDGYVSVGFTESNVENFREYPGVDSESRNIEHGFILVQVDGTWRIRDHISGGTVTQYVMDSLKQGTDVDMLDVVLSVLRTRDMIIDDAKANVLARDTPANIVQPFAPVVSRTYDRQAAVDYATKWSLRRNPDWPIYDEWGGNCNNFTSQCLFAGGIPMDYSGKAQWKWYDQRWDRSETASGRSDSWASVNAFYKYAGANLGYGLVAQVDADYWAGEPGDLLQLGFLNAWQHSVLITTAVKSKEGTTFDYLISSNTADKKDFPVSAYLYTMQRLIKVHGWND